MVIRVIVLYLETVCCHGYFQWILVINVLRDPTVFCLILAPPPISKPKEMIFSLLMICHVLA